MHYRMICILLLIGALGGCSNTGNKADKLAINKETDIAERVDLDKAARLNIELGLNYLKQGQVSRAKTKLARAKKLAPKLPEVHYSYAYYQEFVGEISEAEKSYQKAVSLNAKGGNEHNNYGAFLCRQHNYRKAEREFLLALNDPAYSNTAEALENAGLCVLQVPDTAKAKEYFERSLRYDPKRANALLELAILRLKDNNVRESSDYFNRYTQVAKQSARSLMLGIELAKVTGDRNKESSYRLLLKSQFPDANHAALYNVRIRS